MGDDATFTLFDPSGATVASQTYVPGGGSNASWTELATFTPAGAGTYQLTISVSDDDDNSWRLSAAHDPDCPTGGCATSELVDGDEIDDPDGVPGTADELQVGIQRSTFQHAGTGTVCNDFYFFVDNSDPVIELPQLRHRQFRNGHLHPARRIDCQRYGLGQRNLEQLNNGDPGWRQLHHRCQPGWLVVGRNLPDPQQPVHL